jgi:hypothetical protein
MAHPAWHLAQINIGRVRGPMDSPVMAEFKAALDEINALAEASPGFVWRLKDDSGNATAIHEFPDPRLLVNMSVWTDVASLQAYEKFDRAHLALWWIPVGHIPTVDEAKTRLDRLDQAGPTPEAFTFRAAFPPPTSAGSATP